MTLAPFMAGDRGFKRTQSKKEKPLLREQGRLWIGAEAGIERWYGSLALQGLRAMDRTTYPNGYPHRVDGTLRNNGF